jgi:hypothetical protein
MGQEELQIIFETGLRLWICFWKHNKPANPRLRMGQLSLPIDLPFNLSTGTLGSAPVRNYEKTLRRPEVEFTISGEKAVYVRSPYSHSIKKREYQ